MGHELSEIRKELQEISKSVNQMIPKLDFCVQGFKDQDLKQGFMETLLATHDVIVQQNKRDLDGLHPKVDQLIKDEAIRQATERIRASAEKVKSGEVELIKWSIFKDFLTIMVPKFLKLFWPYILSATGIILAAVWELFKK